MTDGLRERCLQDAEFLKGTLPTVAALLRECAAALPEPGQSDLEQAQAIVAGEIFNGTFEEETMSAAIAAALAAVRAEERAKYVPALERAHERFMLYGEHHAKKGDHEKARVNFDMAHDCAAAIRAMKEGP